MSRVEELERLWQEDFPLTRAMDISVESYAGHRLVTRAALAPNTNTHGTAFAGSLYTLEALTAWSLLHLEILEAGLEASIIHASGKIDFYRTIEKDIIAQCDFTEHLQRIEELAQTGKTRLTLTSEVYVGGEPASRFTGNYTARLTR